MVRFERINKIFGVRKVAHIMQPRVIDEEEFVLPHNSAIIEYANEYIGNPLYDRTSRNTYVFIADSYISDTIGKFRRLSITTSALIGKLKKLDEAGEFKFLLNTEKLWEVPASKLILIDAYRTRELYRYPKSKTSEYNEYMNRLSNALMYTMEPDKLTNRHVFLTINIPKRIPTLVEILRYRKLRGYRITDDFGSTDILVILELIKEISGIESVFSPLLNKQGSDLVLVFTIGGKVTMVKYDYLLSLNNELQLDTPINGFGAKKAVKVFLKYVLQISLSPAKTINELETEAMTDTSYLKEDGDNDEQIEMLIERHNEKSVLVIEEDNKKENMIDLSIADASTQLDNIEANLKDKLDNGEITQKAYDKVLAVAKEANTELLENTIKPDDLKLTISKHPSNPHIIDDNMLDNTIEQMTTEYLSKVYKKQQKETILSAGGTGHVISNHTVTLEKNAANEYEHHEFSITQPNGRTIKRKLIIPYVDDEGFMKINGTRYKLRKQKGDIPIRKISSTQVSLSSYYSKIFIQKARVNSNNSAVSLHKQLLARVGDDISMLLSSSMEFLDVDLGIQYTTMARKVKSFKINGIYCNFDYNIRKSVFGEDSKSGIVFASKGNIRYYINNKNQVTDDKGTKLGTLYQWLRIDEKSVVPEFATIGLMGQHIPLVLPLIFYYGLIPLLESTETKYKIYGVKDDVGLKDSEFVIKFKNNKLVIDSSSKYGIILFGAMQNMKELKTMELETLNYKSGALDLFHSLQYSVKLNVELNNLVSLWVDPITRVALEYINEPTTWKRLLFRAAELLTTNQSKHQNNSSELMIKGYERINGMAYHIISKAIRDNEHKLGKINLNLELNRYDMVSMLSEDSTLMAEDDLNPISALKIKEEVTLTGKFGRNKEAVSVKDKVFHKSNIGVISEATKDNKDVAVTAYMPMSPKVDNMYGITNEDKGEMTHANKFSSSSVLAPESYRDDGKRMLMISIQNSHKIPTTSSRVLPVRTGFETILPYKMDKKFIGVMDKYTATVKQVTKKKIVVSYGDKDVTYKLFRWTSKEVGGTSFVHTLTTNLKEGAKLVNGDIIYYDKAFFGVDIFNKHRVVYKGGETVRVAFDESQEVYEDSGSISSEFSERFSTDIVSSKTVMIKSTHEIIDVIKLGTKVTYHDALVVINDQEGDTLELGLSDKAKNILSEHNKSAPPAKTRGTLLKIEARYNDDIENMSDSVKELIISCDKQLKSETGYVGKVDNTYSVKGEPLLPGEIELKFYLEKKHKMQIVDKAVIANQLKFTVGKIMDKIVDEDGNSIDLKFGYRNVGARIVSSPEVIGTTMLILEDIDKEIVSVYF